MGGAVSCVEVYEEYSAAGCGVNGVDCGARVAAVVVALPLDRNTRRH
jgi:hypothetical protein